MTDAQFLYVISTYTLIYISALHRFLCPTITMSQSQSSQTSSFQSHSFAVDPDAWMYCGQNDYQDRYNPVTATGQAGPSNWGGHLQVRGTYLTPDDH
jgi:hypothetical protein